MNSNMSWIALGCFAVAACSGGGTTASSGTTGTSGAGTTAQGTGNTGTEAVEGLDLPEKLTVLSAKEDAGAGAAVGSAKSGASMSSKTGSGTLSFGESFTAKTYNEAGTAYAEDEVDVYVYDSSMESLNMINEIICYMSQTAAAEMVNEGPYIALVNEERCRQSAGGGAGTGQTGQSSAGETTSFARWIIESERTDNASPQTVKLWVPESAGGEGEVGPEQILVEITATEGRSDEKPFGSFVMNFKGVADMSELGLGAEVETMRGMLATVENDDGKPQFRFVNLGGSALGLEAPFGFSQAANVRLDDADGTSGVALTRNEESWTDPMWGESGSVLRSYAIAYDETRFASSRDENDDGIGEEQVCRARDQFDTHVWRYGLYHREDAEFRGTAVTGGDRVALDAGFPFAYDSDDDGLGDTYGWVGYHGLWIETDEALPDGATIEKHDYESGTGAEHTVRIAPGRLTRRVAHQALLSAFAGDEFEYFGAHPALGYGNWMVSVGESLDFVVTAAVEWGEEGPVYSATIDHDGDPGTAEIGVYATLELADQEVLWMWSQSLGGSVVYTHDASLAAGERELKYYAEAFVSPSDSALFPLGTLEDTLYCYERCLKGGLTQDVVDQAESAEALFHPYQGQPLTYTVALDDGKVVLIDDSNGEAVDATALSLSGLGHDWGINTGEMVTEPLANPAAPWEVYDEPMSYRWETGPNQWNRMVTVVDASGNVLEFDRPLELDYVHSTANDANGSSEFHGKRFLLHYGSFGDLGGFPWRAEGDSQRWYPAVTLADGTILSDGRNDFAVKALDAEQRMREVPAAECAALDAEAAYDDASLALPGFDDIGTVSITLADRPALAGAAPAVIEGVVQ